MRYFLDTNIIIFYLRKKETKNLIEEQYSLFENEEDFSVASVVTLGELEAIAIRNNWGEKRVRILEDFLSKCAINDIHAEDIIKKYGEIDAFSQNKLDGKPLGMTARNMGKNDLWIAATVSVTESTLLTTDKDFAHLNGTFLDLELINLEEIKNEI